MPLPTGTPAPDFTLKGKGLVDVSLSDHKGKDNVLLLFFPGAFTTPCTAEFCDVSNGLASFEGAVVYGISGDTPFAQDAWAEKAGITVPLLADYQKTVMAAYDLMLPDLLGLGPSAARGAVLIDKAGTIRYSEQTTTPKDMPDFAAIKALLKELA